MDLSCSWQLSLRTQPNASRHLKTCAKVYWDSSLRKIFSKRTQKTACPARKQTNILDEIGYFPPLNQEFICLVLMTRALDETTWHIVLGHLRVSSPDNTEWSHSCWEAGWFKLPCRQLPSKIWDLGIMMPMPGYMYLFLFHITWGSEEHIFSSYKQQENPPLEIPTWRHLDKGQQVTSGHWFHLLDTGSCTVFHPW